MLNEFERLNRQELGNESYQALMKISPELAETALWQRDDLVRQISSALHWSHKGTKAFTGTLSPGCQVCARGEWSCLFISNLCNCHCFYCPTLQDSEDVPSTNNLVFPDPDMYAAYLAYFGFSGASISGGEPLMTFDKSLAYLKAVKERLGNDYMVWLYTNGTLSNPSKLDQLAAAGLREIRFDIGATGMKPKFAAEAVDRIPVVTIEIPAIPEEEQVLKALLPEMKRAGIQHLNLHQLRITPFNYAKLVKRNYHYIHGLHMTVLESELSALEILRAASQGPSPAVNYCSFVYKNRFQRSAARWMYGTHYLLENETITENGYTRQFTTGGQPAKSRELADGVSYFVVRAVNNLSYAYPYKEIRLTPKHKIFIERGRAASFDLLPGQDQPEDRIPEAAMAYEHITPRLQDYQ